MAFQLNPLSFLGASGPVPQYQGLADIFKNYNAAKESGLNQEQMQLQNALQRALNPGAVRQQQAQILGQEQQNQFQQESHPGALQAQSANNQKQALENALNALLNPGKVKEQNLKNRQTELGNQSLEATNPYQAGLLQAQIAHQNALAKAANAPATQSYSGEIKHQLEMEELAKTNPALYEKIAKQEREELRTKLVPQQLRERLGFQKNVQKLFKEIDQKALTRYSGIGGTLAAALNKAGSATVGAQSKEFKDHEKALTGVSVLAEEIRKLFDAGQSTQTVQEFHDLTDTSYWARSPKVALAKFKELMHIIEGQNETWLEQVPEQFRDDYRLQGTKAPNKSESKAPIKYNNSSSDPNDWSDEAIMNYKGGY